MSEEYLSLEEVATRLGLTKAEVIAAVNGGQLRGFKDGSSYKFREEDVKKYIEKSQAGDSALSYDLDDENEGHSSDINSTLDRDSTLFSGDSGIGLSDGGSDLSAAGSDAGLQASVYDDDGDDLVLQEAPIAGGSSGSGLLGEGSGISLLSADDSGITLDDSSDVLELPEDSTLGSSIAGGLSGSLVASLTGISDEDFQLGNNDELEDDDDDSDSQVIPLAEDEEEGDDAPAIDFTAASTGPSTPATYMVDPALMAELEDLRRPQKPYSVWNLLGLIFCFLFLAVTLMFTVDLLRNMWSWDQPTQFSSSMMDWVIDNVVKKVQESQQ